MMMCVCLLLVVGGGAGVWATTAPMPEPNPIDGMFDDQMHRDALDPELCAAQLREMSAFEFYDASFRVPQGLLQLNLVNFGNFFQCLSIRQELGAAPIEGKHCLIHLPLGGSIVDVTLPELPELPWNITLPGGGAALRRYRDYKRGVQLLTGARDLVVRSAGKAALDDPVLDLLGAEIQLGVCIPRSCPVPQALGVLFNSSLHTVNYEQGLCRLPGDRVFAPVDYLAIVIFSLIGLVTIVSTGYDVRHTVILKRDPKQLSQLYSCCSVYTNTRRLFTFRPVPGALACLDGIRSLSIMWVILGHSFICLYISHFSNLSEALEYYNSANALWLNAANISVDTFFMLSGLLVVYTSIPKLTQMSLIKNLHLFYLNRLLRMFPILATAVLLQASLFFHVTDGANWGFAATNTKTCRTYWWAAFLYIQNYYLPQEECLPHTWYLSVDMQLYFLSPLVLVWLLGSRRVAWSSLAAALLLTLAASTVYVFMSDIGPTMFTSDGLAYWTKYYVNVLTRAPVFFVGMLLGYLLHVCKGKKVTTLPTWLGAVCWATALVLSSLVIYSFYGLTLDVSPALANITNVYIRSLWALALGWLIYACVHGYGGPLAWFLSLTVFKWIARVSYAMYIFHYPLQFLAGAATLAPVHFSVMNVDNDTLDWTTLKLLDKSDKISRFVYDLSLTLLVSTVVCVLVDAPFSTLQKLLLGGGGKKPAPKLQPPGVKISDTPVVNSNTAVVNGDTPVVNGNTTGVISLANKENGFKEVIGDTVTVDNKNDDEIKTQT